MSALSAVVIASLSDPRCIAPVPPEYVRPFAAAYKAIVEQESGGDALALHDDDVGRSYHPPTIEEAERIAKSLLAQGRSVGIGLGQLTARSEEAFERKFGITVHEALANPCANMRAGSELYAQGIPAIATYNCGKPWCASDYVKRVLARLGATGNVLTVPREQQKPSGADADEPQSESYDMSGSGEDRSLMTIYEGDN